MPRDLPIGNGNVFISFDSNYLLREFYFPHVGQENHVNGEFFRFGLWVDGIFSWIPDGWEIHRDYLDDSLVTNVALINKALEIKIKANDLVDFQENLYLKRLTVENLSGKEREIRLFLAQDFHIYGNNIGDTAEFRPEVNGLLHYKQERYFLVNIFANQKFGIDFFATGNKEKGKYEGTWKDAEDGLLSKNPIAQGSVDSVLGIPLFLPPHATESCYYWIAIGKNWEEVANLNEMVKKQTPEKIFKATFDYWKLWVDNEHLNYDLLSTKISRLYKRSLLICRTHMNNCGSIISGCDSDVIYFNRDTYSYMWPRDGAMVALGFHLAGYRLNEFYLFCAKILEKEGYFLHKYTPSGSLASSWHPWLKENHPQLPIQEDETALVLFSLWHHFKIFKDIELIRSLYHPFIRKAADFLMNYRDFKTGLPLPSYDLWEEQQGILTFTISAVFGGLTAAAKFALEFGEKDVAKEYLEGASNIKKALEQYLYLKEEKRFARMINFRKEKSMEIDATIDASLYGIFAFGVYSAEDEKVFSTMQQIEAKLWNAKSGGLSRYENDSYYRDSSQKQGNPWFITTLWLAQYYIAIAKNKKDLEKPKALMEWVADHALDSGVLAEQLNAHSNAPISVTPLTWSHGMFITVTQEYLNKLVELEKCPACGLSKIAKNYSPENDPRF